MIRKYLLLGLSISAVSLVQSQVSLEVPTEYVNNSTSGGLNTLPPNVEGSPYLDEAFKPGRVHVGEEQEYAASMRYNAYRDEIEIKAADGVTSLFKRDYVWADIAGDLFVIAPFKGRDGISEGYFILLNQGDVRLLKRITKEFMESQPAASSYSQDRPPRFLESVEYYLIGEEGPAREVRLRKKDVLEFLSDSGAAESFIKKEGLKLKSEEEVIRLLGYLNGS
ncbi:hypothetical protein [Robiginitalea sp. SC105]|uniref:hypothetical protein n=1 Tax=Robiginitalea sp. SC105 TaxID=2762332 RepID=UPI0016396B52|nr:hypothetical protein [Robiginitalea sp. SC105]MBC2837701.1 hypothetical protein [Robiginitalea sp. SC105]